MLYIIPLRLPFRKRIMITNITIMILNRRTPNKLPTIVPTMGSWPWDGGETVVNVVAPEQKP